MGYYAETDANGIVQRVIVADSVAWCVQHLGGTWAETADPYAEELQTVRYCGPGHGHDETWPERFAPQWVQPVGSEDAYPPDVLVFHNGRIWKSTTPANVWEPGVANWRDTPEVGLPMWVQPSGSEDAYALGDEVTHNGQNWRSLYASNVWIPGQFGWELIA